MASRMDISRACCSRLRAGHSGASGDASGLLGASAATQIPPRAALSPWVRGSEHRVQAELRRLRPAHVSSPHIAQGPDPQVPAAGAGHVDLISIQPEKTEAALSRPCQFQMPAPCGYCTSHQLGKNKGLKPLPRPGHLGLQTPTSREGPRFSLRVSSIL